MPSIMKDGSTFHGISVCGVFTDENGTTYAGQHRDGYACGLGVTTWSHGTKDYAEYGPEGDWDGRNLGRRAGGDINYCLVLEKRMQKCAYVYADGRCWYNGVAFALDDPCLLALIAQVAPVEVRPAPAIARHSPSSIRPMRRLVLHPQALATAVATEVHSHAARRTPSLVAVRHNPTAAALLRTTTQ
jgi:hypothetical protein